LEINSWHGFRGLEDSPRVCHLLETFGVSRDEKQINLLCLLVRPGDDIDPLVQSMTALATKWTVLCLVKEICDLIISQFTPDSDSEHVPSPPICLSFNAFDE
jgi:hypothetical protein